VSGFECPSAPRRDPQRLVAWCDETRGLEGAVFGLWGTPPLVSGCVTHWSVHWSYTSGGEQVSPPRGQVTTLGPDDDEE